MEYISYVDKGRMVDLVGLVILVSFTFTIRKWNHVETIRQTIGLRYV